MPNKSVISNILNIDKRAQQLYRLCISPCSNKHVGLFTNGHIFLFGKNPCPPFIQCGYFFLDNLIVP